MRTSTRCCAAASSAPAAAPAAPAVVAEPGRSRDNPIAATFLSRRLLNKQGSEKETWHIEFDLSGCGLDYVVGDPACATMSGWWTRSSRSALPHHQGERQDAARGPDRRRSAGAGAGLLFELISFIIGATREKARALAQGEDPDGDAATLDVMAVLQKFSGVRPHPEAFVEALEPLQPRLYSISSSHNATPGKLSLTVDCVRYVINKRKR